MNFCAILLLEIKKDYFSKLNIIKLNNIKRVCKIYFFFQTKESIPIQLQRNNIPLLKKAISQ